MSIRRIQTEQVLSAVARHLYASGIDPTTNEILRKTSQYFSTYEAGIPLPFPSERISSNKKSNVQDLNLILIHLRNNLDVLYQACLEQVGEVLDISQTLKSDIDRLEVRRKRVGTQVDDFLLSLYNTDGYYYSSGENFSDTSLTDLTMTTAFVDVSHNQVILPTVGSLTKTLDPSLIGPPVIMAWTGTTPVAYQSISPFNFSINGTDNTVWEIQVVTNIPSEVVVTLTIPLGNINNPVSISRADFDPYAMTSIQIFGEAGKSDTNGHVGFTSFGNNITTGLNEVSFIDNLTEVVSFRFTLRKTTYDYTDSTGGSIQYHYVFGAKDIAFIQQVYDNNAIFVSTSLGIPKELYQNMVIDAVSLTTIDSSPPDTNITYYVANDPQNSATPSLGDFVWKRIEPVGVNTSGVPAVIDFNGTQSFERMITSLPTPNDLQLIPLDNTNTDLSKRNPSPTIIPAVDIYTLCNFTDNPLLDSLNLTEGINTTRIYWTPYDKTAWLGLSYWGNVINNNSPKLNTLYGRIDTGTGFFYGGDIGQSGISVYIETYLQLDTAIPPILAKITKADPNSRTWSVRSFLNGRQVGSLPGRNQDTYSVLSSSGGAQVPIDSSVCPWGFQPGLNHIAVLINIPTSVLAGGIANPYIGILQLLENESLSNIGTVKLADWSYVSFFDMQYNQARVPETFTIYNNQIISRRPPTANFRLQYSQATMTGPVGVRVRADLTRDISNQHITPQLDQYRLRFSIGNGLA